MIKSMLSLIILFFSFCSTSYGSLLELPDEMLVMDCHEASSEVKVIKVYNLVADSYIVAFNFKGESGSLPTVESKKGFSSKHGGFHNLQLIQIEDDKYSFFVSEVQSDGTIKSLIELAELVCTKK